MRILKKINNNVALAVDDHGRDVVVFGKGVGFAEMPYELEDPSRIQRMFYGVDEASLSQMEGIPGPVLVAASDIVDLARMELDCRLNPNLPFTLADHLAFAIERNAEGIDLTNPLAAQVEQVYPREAELGHRGVLMVRGRTGVELPDSEAFAIALHIVNAEADGGEASTNMDAVVKSTKVIEEVTKIVEDNLGIHVDRTDYSYSRFCAHLRYLVSRLLNGAPMKTENGALFRQAERDFPESYQCAYQVELHLEKTRGWHCSDEELLYLMMHINRLKTSLE